MNPTQRKRTRIEERRPQNYSVRICSGQVCGGYLTATGGNLRTVARRAGRRTPVLRSNTVRMRGSNPPRVGWGKLPNRVRGTLRWRRLRFHVLRNSLHTIKYPAPGKSWFYLHGWGEPGSSAAGGVFDFFVLATSPEHADELANEHLREADIRAYAEFEVWHCNWGDLQDCGIFSVPMPDSKTCNIVIG